MTSQLAKPTGNGIRSMWPSPFTLRPEIEEAFHRMLSGNVGWLGTDVTTPSLDLSETDEGYRARLDVPGVAPDEIDIQVNGNVLSVSGERKEEKEEKGRTYHRTECTYGSFTRSVTLPCDVVEDNVSAKLEGGVLTIELPKAEKSKPRKITIKNGQNA